MARKKKKKSSRKKSFSLTAFSDRKKRKAKQSRQSLLVVAKIIGLVAVLGAIGVGFALLDQYVKSRSEESSNSPALELQYTPAWVNDALLEKLWSAAKSGQELTLDEENTAVVQQNIATHFVWLDKAQVQLTHDSFLITGNWFKPLAMVEDRSGRYYVDPNFVVLNYVPIESLPTPRIAGLAGRVAVKPGNVWQQDDLAAAVEIIEKLDKMDQRVTPEKPLLFEIDRIDVSNFAGRRNRNAAHILLYTKDQTKIIWGAEFGKWQEHLEVKDMEKIARLYNFYTQNRTLLGAARYINLCDPQDYIHQPIDDL